VVLLYETGCSCVRTVPAKCPDAGRFKRCSLSASLPFPQSTIHKYRYTHTHVHVCTCTLRADKREEQGCAFGSHELPCRSPACAGLPLSNRAGCSAPQLSRTTLSVHTEFGQKSNCKFMFLCVLMPFCWYSATANTSLPHTTQM